MKGYEVGISFLVFADDEQHATEQFIELLRDNGDDPNFIFESDAEVPDCGDPGPECVEHAGECD